MHNWRLWMFTALMATSLAACAGNNNEVIIGKVDNLYNDGMDQMEAKQWKKAINVFEELQRQHPYSGWATRSEMMTAYAHFRLSEYDAARGILDDFIRLHPGHEDLPYVYYLKALSYYDEISDVSRDQGNTHEALKGFEEVVRRFPDSVYARDAQLKITLCRDHIAGQEMSIGRYYQQKGRYTAAIDRFQTVLKDYDRTQQIPEALYRMVESYLALGLRDEAKKSAAVLGYNYPNSAWYHDAYKLLNEDLPPAKIDNNSLSKDVWDGTKKLF